MFSRFMLDPRASDFAPTSTSSVAVAAVQAMLAGRLSSDRARKASSNERELGIKSLGLWACDREWRGVIEKELKSM